MTSKCDENKNVAHKAIAEYVTDVLTTFWHFQWSIILEQTHSKNGIYLIYSMKKQQKK